MTDDTFLQTVAAVAVEGVQAGDVEGLDGESVYRRMCQKAELLTQTEDDMLKVMFAAATAVIRLGDMDRG